MTTLEYISEAAINSLLLLNIQEKPKATILAEIGRINCLYMIQKAGSGHIGTSFSSMDILTWLHFFEMNNDDIFFSSKGHDAPAIYTTMIHAGIMPFDKLHLLRRLGGLPGHPDVSTPGMVTNTGSLGMGISKARGMAQAKRLNNKPGRIFVLLGDGELQEGQIYESLQPTANGKYSEITVIIDHNKIQSDTWVKDISDLKNIESKFRAFGWEVVRCNGNDMPSLAHALDITDKMTDRPKLIIADTIKGNGVSFMENFNAKTSNGQYAYHSGACSPDNYTAALEELKSRLKTACHHADCPLPTFENVQVEPASPPLNPQRLISAYGDTLCKLGNEHPELVVLDADLALDCGLIPFRDTHPERFIECGIAEMDMVSMAGGLALSGKLPVVHSFACFLSTRPNEHIFNNATEHTKIVYAGSLAGLVPGGPGHSHQSVRDISTLGSIPGLTLIEPCCETEVRMALTWAVKKNDLSTYIRLVTIPCECSFELPANYVLAPGKGIFLRQGADVVIFAYGPVLTEQAHLTAELLSADGIEVAVVNLPWLNRLDKEWFRNAVGDRRLVVTLDNHMVIGGQGQMLATAAAHLGLRSKVHSIGLNEVPVCGTNSEVLTHHGLDTTSLVKTVAEAL